MRIFVRGQGEKAFAPDQITGSVTFSYHANTYDEALRGGVEKVKNYMDGILEATDFKPEDFKTHSYSVREQFHTNRLDPKTIEDLDKKLEKRVSDGFFFTQYASLTFDYDRMRLAKLLAITSKIPDAPAMHIDFDIKDPDSKLRELIPLAYEDARLKAETLASAAHKNLRDCVHVDIDQPPHHDNEDYGTRYMAKASLADASHSFEQEIKNIDETFKPDDITLSKDISCIWETSD